MLLPSAIASVIVEKSLQQFRKKYVVIAPDVKNVGVLDFKDAEKLIDIGENFALLRGKSQIVNVTKRFFRQKSQNHLLSILRGAGGNAQI